MGRKPRGKCSIWWCDRLHYANGYCVTHYRAVTRYGSPYGKRKEQFSKIDDIIAELRLLIQEVEYPPGRTRDAILWSHIQKIKNKLGEEDTYGD